jgi:hypothetical protein
MATSANISQAPHSYSTIETIWCVDSATLVRRDTFDNGVFSSTVWTDSSDTIITPTASQLLFATAGACSFEEYEEEVCLQPLPISEVNQKFTAYTLRRVDIAGVVNIKYFTVTGQLVTVTPDVTHLVTAGKCFDDTNSGLNSIILNITATNNSSGVSIFSGLPANAKYTGASFYNLSANQWLRVFVQLDSLTSVLTEDSEIIVPPNGTYSVSLSSDSIVNIVCSYVEMPTIAGTSTGNTLLPVAGLIGTHTAVVNLINV